MRIHYYFHVLFDKPGIYDYEVIEDYNNVVQLAAEILISLQSNFDDVFGIEEMNIIDISAWEPYLEENNIIYNEDDGFPYKPIWLCIKNKIETVIGSKVRDEEKFSIISEAVQTYLSLIEDAYIDDGRYVFDIRLFDNSKDFTKYLFTNLLDSLDSKTSLRPFKGRIETILALIEERNFPNNDFQEGILNEWLNIYKMIFED